MKVDVKSFGDSYELSAAVLIYTNVATRHALATKHDVQEHAGRPTIRPGAPLNEQDYRVLVEALAPAQQPRMQWHDPRVLARGLGRMLWWSPPMKRSFFFRKSQHNPRTFDGRALCPCPGLVFLAAAGELYVYAFKGSAAPTRATRLYQAPFFNVWSRGKVCVGNAGVPPQDRSEDPQAWEQMFFGSHFTHPNFTEPDRLTVGVDPARFWRAQVEKPDAQFPEQVLFDLGLTVEGLIHVDLAARLEAIPRATGEF
ncbi:PRTRC system protein B [Ramlibacter sp. AN1133]|uniref:PRTRC system protein B n=1 Tax=Ramlibacter sp. AN1133 TaxID=3133429 RepID=UPI0030C06904